MATNTIAAVSSPVGNSLKGVIRLSGSKAFALTDKLAGKIIPKNSWRSRKLKLSLPLADNRASILLPVTIYLMPAPHSYTREDVAEIHTLGSKVLLGGVLQYFVRQGAVLAQPGEFTKRAFINGRISLAQSETVLNLINSSTKCHHRLAVKQLQQHHFRQLREINRQLFNLVSQIELTLDFSDQEIEVITPEQIKSALKRIIIGINRNIGESSGRAVNMEGIICILCGRPNTGKSSLFNRLVRSRRNIVSPISGTTRDYLEGKMVHKNTAFRVFDTAGISRPEHQRAYWKKPGAFPEVDINLLVIDGSQGVVKQDRTILKSLNPSKTIVVVNKIDLLRGNLVLKIPHYRVYFCSARTGAGVSALKKALIAMVQTVPPERSSDQALINLRQKEAIDSCLTRLNKALAGVNNKISYEFITGDIKNALEQLNMISVGFDSGKHPVTEDILNNIFSKFCLGK